MTCDTEDFLGPDYQVSGETTSKFGGKTQQDQLQPVLDLWMSSKVGEHTDDAQTGGEKRQISIGGRADAGVERWRSSQAT